jgi:hypothetical protein
MQITEFTRNALAIRRQMRDLHDKGYERISCAHGIGNLWELDRGYRYQCKIVDAVIGFDGKSVFVKVEAPAVSE